MAQQVTFDLDFYVASKFAQLEAAGRLNEFGLTSEADLKANFFPTEEAAKSHYAAFGAAEGINPSADFDTNAYLDAKLAQLADLGGFESITTRDALLEAFSSAGLSPLEHFNTYGIDEGLSATPVDAPASDLTEALAAYETAVEAESEAEVAFSEAVVEANLEAETDADDDGVADAFDPEANDYVLQAESALLSAQQTLNGARQTTTDAKLAQNVVDAQKLVNEDTAKYSEGGAALTAVYEVTAAGDSGFTPGDYYADGAAFGTAETKLVGYVDPTDGADDLDITANKVTVLDTEDGGAVDNSGSSVTDLLITTTYSALQLQSRLSAAEASLAGNIASKGETADLADQLNDDIALYQANNTPNAALGTLQTALQTYLAKVEAGTAGDADVVTVLEAASTAEAAIFDSEDVSLLADGATGDSIESLVSTLDTRDTLSDAVTAADNAFQATANGSALVTAETAVETREDQIQAVADAEASVEAVTDASSAYASAQQAVTDAGEELGYTIEAIDSGIEFATDEADLFTFDAEDLESTPDVVINDLASDDLVYLGSDYALGAEGSADNNALEVFVTEVNGNAVLQVENTAFGSASDDFTEVTLTGVAAADVSIDSGVVSIA